MRGLQVLLSAAVVCAAARVALGGTFAEVNPRRGSALGGTRITLTGSGFARGGQEGTTSVYVGAQPCAVEEYFSTDTQLVCITPYLGAETTVTVSVIIEATDRYETLFTSSSSLGQFRYDWDDTPIVQDSVVAGSGGDELFLRGQLRASTYENMEIRVGGSLCDASEELNEGFEERSSWSTGDMRCRLPNDLPPGRQNISVLAQAEGYRGYGLGLMEALTKQVDLASGVVYHFTAVPRITRVSAHAAGAGGGSLVVIEGRSFSDNSTENKITLAGVPCEVLSSTRERIVCRTGSYNFPAHPAPAANETFDASAVAALPVVPGGRGLAARWHDGNDGTGINSNMFRVGVDAKYPFRPDRTTVQAGAVDIPHAWRELRRYGAVWEGFFEAPVTAKYQFESRADDRMQMWLTPTPWDTSDPNNTLVGLDADQLVSRGSRILDSVRYTSSWTSYSSQQSDKIALEGGKLYFVRFVHWEYGGGAWADVRMRIFDADPADFVARLGDRDASGVQAASTALAAEANTAYIAGAATAQRNPGARGASGWPRTAEVFKSVAEEQYLYIDADVQRELHVVRVEGYNGGKFDLSWFLGDTKPTTEEMDWDVSASTLCSEYRSKLPGCNSAGCSRDAITNSSTGEVLGYEWTVSVNCPTSSQWVLPTVRNRGLSAVSGRDQFLTATRTRAHSEVVGGSFRICVACGMAQYRAAFALWQGNVTALNEARKADGSNITLDFSPTGMATINYTQALGAPAPPAKPADAYFTPYLSFASSWSNVELALQQLETLQALTPGGGPTDVSVSQGGNAYDGRNFYVTFHLPTGDVPTLEMDTTYLTGANVRGRVVVAQEGSHDPLLFKLNTDWFRTAVPVPAGAMAAGLTSVGGQRVTTAALAGLDASQTEGARSVVGTIQMSSKGYRAVCDHFAAGEVQTTLPEGVSAPLPVGVSASTVRSHVREVLRGYAPSSLDGSTRAANELEEVVWGELYSTLYAAAETRLLSQYGSSSVSLSAFSGSPALQGLPRRADCLFSYTETLTPTVLSAGTKGETGAAAQQLVTWTTLRIEGQGFLPELPGMDNVRPAYNLPLVANGTVVPDSSDGNTVFLRLLATAEHAPEGASVLPTLRVECNVTKASTSYVECTVPNMVAGTYEVEVLVGRDRGYAVAGNATAGMPRLVYAPAVDDFYPAAGSLLGGSLLAVRGRGFRPYDATAAAHAWRAPNVTVGGAPCLVARSTFRTVFCRTPPATAAVNGSALAVAQSSATGRVLAGVWADGVRGTAAAAALGLNLDQTDFAYATDFTPVATWVQPAVLSPAVQGSLVFRLAGLTASQEAALANASAVTPSTVAVTAAGPARTGERIALEAESLDEAAALAAVRARIQSTLTGKALRAYLREIERADKKAQKDAEKAKNSKPPVSETAEATYVEPAVSVLVDDRECAFSSWNGSHLTCTLPPGPAPLLPQALVLPRVFVRHGGRAVPAAAAWVQAAAAEDRATLEASAPGNHLVERGLRVTSVSPASLSWAGGTAVTIRGVGFAGNNVSDVVSLEANVTVNSTADSRMLFKVACAVTGASSTELNCTTASGFVATPAQSFDGTNFTGLAAALLSAAAAEGINASSLLTDARFTEARLRVVPVVTTNGFEARRACGDALSAASVPSGYYEAPGLVLGSAQACGTSFTTAATPQLVSARFLPAQGATPDVLDLKGVHLGRAAGAGTTIRVGAKTCTVLSVDVSGNLTGAEGLDQVTCAVADDKAGTVAVSATVSPLGHANGTAVHTHLLRLDGVVNASTVALAEPGDGSYNWTLHVPPRTSVAGGRIVSLVGYGFDAVGESDRRKQMGALEALLGPDGAASALGITAAHSVLVSVSSSSLVAEVVYATHRRIDVRLPARLGSGATPAAVSVALVNPHVLAGEPRSADDLDSGDGDGAARRSLALLSSSSSSSSSSSVSTTEATNKDALDLLPLFGAAAEPAGSSPASLGRMLRVVSGSASPRLDAAARAALEEAAAAVERAAERQTALEEAGGRVGQRARGLATVHGPHEMEVDPLELAASVAGHGGFGHEGARHSEAHRVHRRLRMAHADAPRAAVGDGVRTGRREADAMASTMTPRDREARLGAGMAGSRYVDEDVAAVRRGEVESSVPAELDLLYEDSHDEDAAAHASYERGAVDHAALDEAWRVLAGAVGAEVADEWVPHFAAARALLDAVGGIAAPRPTMPSRQQVLAAAAAGSFDGVASGSSHPALKRAHLRHVLSAAGAGIMAPPRAALPAVPDGTGGLSAFGRGRRALRSAVATHRAARRLASPQVPPVYTRGARTATELAVSVAGAVVYDASATPVLSGLSPLTGAAGTLVELTGSNLGAGGMPAGATITFGAVACAPLAANWTDTSVWCALGDVPQGNHRAVLYVPDQGYALVSGSRRLTIAGAVAAVHVEGGVVGAGGGNLVRIRGSGFPTVTEAQADAARRGRVAGALRDTDVGAVDAPAAPGPLAVPQVHLCNTGCDLVRSAPSELVCRARSLPTAAGLSSYFNQEPKLLAPAGRVRGWGSSFSSSRPREAAFDGNLDTYAQGPWGGCSLGLDMGAHSRAIVTKVRFFPRYYYADRTADAVFEGSVDGVSWTQLARVTGRPLASWNVISLVDPQPDPVAGDGSWIDFAAQPAFRYLRYAGADGSYCMLEELEFIGYEVAAAADGKCAPRVTLPSGNADTVSTGVRVPGDEAGGNVTFSLPTSVSSAPGTPVVTGISPSFGSALGGTTVTLTGHNLAGVDDAVAAANVSVRLAGVPCAVQTVSPTTITCVTGKRDVIRRPAVEVAVGTLGRSFGYASAAGKTETEDDAFTVPSGYVSRLLPGGALAVVNGTTTRFRYLDLWSATTTWRGGVLPRQGDSVVVPPGQTVLLDVAAPRLFLVLVQGELVYAHKHDINLSAEYVLVLGGRVEIGTKAEPMRHRVSMTLYGDRWNNVELPQVGAKMLAIRNFGAADADATAHGGVVEGDDRAVLDVHGTPRRRSWTRIAADVAPGSSEVTTAEPTDWVVGDRIVVSSSTTQHAQAEVRTIVRVINGSHYEVAPAFSHRHLAEIFRAGQFGHSDADMRAAVGLLSHNIVLSGGDEEQSDAQLFGLHTGAFGGGVYRLEFAEVHHCGQGFILGRYCTHTHMMGKAADGSYVKNLGVHDSYQRAATIHGVTHYQVKHNVAYKIKGHSIFVEDGAETWNVIEENLVIGTVPSKASLKSDLKPASFWMAGPLNIWRSNFAAGCSHDGYWFEPPATPHGPSATSSICPVHWWVGEFYNNSASANGVHGLRIYPTFLPHAEPCNAGGSAPKAQYFYNFTSFRNGNHGIFGKKNGDLHHINAKLIQNSGDDLFWTKYPREHVEYRPNDPNVLHALVVADTRTWNTPGAFRGSKVGIFAPQDEFWHAQDVWFVGYENSGALSACAKCGSATDQKQGGYTYRLGDAKYLNSPRRFKWTAPFKQIIWDLDGSVTGWHAGNVSARQSALGADAKPLLFPKGGFVTPWKDFLHFPGQCDRPGTANGGVDAASVTAYNPLVASTAAASTMFDGGIVCDPTAAVRRFVTHHVNPEELDFQRLTVRAPSARVGGWDYVLMFEKEHWGWVTPLVTGKVYEMGWERRVDATDMRLRYSDWPYLNASSDLRLDSLVASFNYSYIRHRTEATVGRGYAAQGYEFKAPLVVKNKTAAGFDVSRRDGVGLPPIIETLAEAETEDALYAGADAVALSWLDGRRIDLDQDGRLPNPGRGDGLGVTYTNFTERRVYTLMTGVNTSVPFGVNHGLDKTEVLLEAKACPPGGCIKPERGSYGPPVDWSDPFNWPGRKLPVEGTDCVIPNGKHIVFDIPYMRCELLTINGKLSFADGADRTLVARNILVWGALEMGTPAAPLTSNARIILRGSGALPLPAHEQPPPVDDALHPIGHKMIFVAGNFSAAGQPVRRPWTRLSATAAAGATSITLAESVSASGTARGWRAGDRIVLTPTSYAPEGVTELDEEDEFGFRGGGAPGLETATVVSVSTNGRVVTLASPLQHSHFGGSVDLSGEGAPGAPTSLSLGAGVGLLTRNVRIMGDMGHIRPGEASQAYNTTLGGHILVSEVAPGGEDSRVPRDYTDDDSVEPIPDPYQGKLDLQFVELNHMGKGNVEFGAIELRFDILPPSGRSRVFIPGGVGHNPVQNVHGCSFSDSHNYGVRARGTHHLRVTDSVFHRTYRNTLYVDRESRNATAERVLSAGNLRAAADTHNRYTPRGAFYFDVVPGSLKDCLSGGSYDTGFTVRMPSCPRRTGFSYANGDGANPETGLIPYDFLPAAADPFRGNEAHANRVGAFLLSDKGSATHSCRSFTGFTAWKSAHVGVVTVDQTANLLLRDVRVLDNHIGVSLNFFRLGTAMSHVLFSRGVVAGSTAASTADGCSASVECRAFGPGAAETDGSRCASVLGTGWRRAGFMTPQFTNRGKTCEHDWLPVCRPPNFLERTCSLPWEKRYGLPGTRHARMIIEDTVFADFTGHASDPAIPTELFSDPHLAGANGTTVGGLGFLDVASQSDCGLRSRAIVHNPTQVDYAVPTVLRRLRWVRAPLQSRFSFSYEASTDGKCTSAGCDGFNYINFLDADGTTSVTGMKKSLILYQHPGAGAGAPLCRSIPGWRGLQCGLPDPHTREIVQVRGAVMENVDASRGQLILHPVRLSRAGVGNGVYTVGDAANSLASGNAPSRARGDNSWVTSGADVRNISSTGPIDDGCAKRFFFGQYPMFLEPNKETRVAFTATLPGTLRVHFHSTDPTEVVRVALFVQRPNSIEVWHKQRKVPSETSLERLARPGLDASVAAGANLFSPQNRTLWFVMRGGDPSAYYDIKRQPAVQLNLTFAVSVEEFYGTNVVSNLATLLSIPASRIRIVDVQSGSTNAVVEIASATESSSSTAETVGQVSELVDLAVAVKKKVVAGQFDVGLPVAALDIGVSMPALTEAPQDPNQNATLLAENGQGDAFAAGVLDDDALVLDDDFSAGGGGGGGGGTNTTDLTAAISGIFDTLAAEGIRDLSGQSGEEDEDNVFVYTPPSDDDDDGAGFFTTEAIIGIAVGAGVLAAVGLVGLYTWRSRAQARRRTKELVQGKPGAMYRPGRDVEFVGTNPERRMATGDGPPIDRAAASVQHQVLRGAPAAGGAAASRDVTRVQIQPSRVRKSRGAEV